MLPERFSTSITSLNALAHEARALLDRLHTLNPGNKKFYSYSLVLARLQRA